MGVKQHHYTQEHIDFIFENKTLMSSELAAQFNEQFNVNVSPNGIQQKRRNLGIRCKKLNLFAKGCKPWNKGLSGSQFAVNGKVSQFKKGHVPKHTNPIGHERPCNRSGELFVKVTDQNSRKGKGSNYRPKKVVEWEKVNGPLTKGAVIKFIDGDILNCEPDNLIMVSNAVHIRMRAMGWGKLAKDAKQTAALVCKLEHAINQKESE